MRPSLNVVWHALVADGVKRTLDRLAQRMAQDVDLNVFSARTPSRLLLNVHRDVSGASGAQTFAAALGNEFGEEAPVILKLGVAAKLMQELQGYQSLPESIRRRPATFAPVLGYAAEGGIACLMYSHSKARSSHLDSQVMLSELVPDSGLGPHERMFPEALLRVGEAYTRGFGPWQADAALHEGPDVFSDKLSRARLDIDLLNREVSEPHLKGIRLEAASEATFPYQFAGGRRLPAPWAIAATECGLLPRFSGTIHGDLHGGNVVFTVRAVGVPHALTIIDFGCVRQGCYSYDLCKLETNLVLTFFGKRWRGGTNAPRVLADLVSLLDRLHRCHVSLSQQYGGTPLLSQPLEIFRLVEEHVDDQALPWDEGRILLLKGLLMLEAAVSGLRETDRNRRTRRMMQFLLQLRYAGRPWVDGEMVMSATACLWYACSLTIPECSVRTVLDRILRAPPDEGAPPDLGACDLRVLAPLNREEALVFMLERPVTVGDERIESLARRTLLLQPVLAATGEGWRSPGCGERLQALLDTDRRRSRWRDVAFLVWSVNLIARRQGQMRCEASAGLPEGLGRCRDGLRRLSASTQASDSLRGWAYHLRGWLAAIEDDVVGAERNLVTAVAHLRTAKFLPELAKALNTLGHYVYEFRLDHDAAEKCLRESLHLKTRCGDRAGLGFALGGLGNIARRQGRYGLAIRWYRQDLALSQPGDMAPSAEKSVLVRLALCYLRLAADPCFGADATNEHLREAESLLDQVNSRWPGDAWERQARLRLLMLRGDEHRGEALASRLVGDYSDAKPYLRGMMLREAARALTRLGGRARLTASARALRAAAQAFEEGGLRSEFLATELDQAIVLWYEGHPVGASRLVAQVPVQFRADFGESANSVFWQDSLQSLAYLAERMRARRRGAFDPVPDLRRICTRLEF